MKILDLKTNKEKQMNLKRGLYEGGISGRSKGVQRHNDMMGGEYDQSMS
jgi:hypothetical protein